MTIPKANKFVAEAIASMGLTVPNKYAIAETLLDQYVVNGMEIAQVDDAGKCLVFVYVNNGINDETRVVGDSNGAVKLYTDLARVSAMIKHASPAPDAEFIYHPKVKQAAVGDPVAMLKNLHKALAKERDSSAAVMAKRQASITVATGLGWATLPKLSAQRVELDQYQNELLSVSEVNANAVAKLAKYATLLTNAGINPATYLPIV